MINRLNKIIFSKNINFVVLALLFFSFTLSRSFMGLYLFGFRIGEYLIAFAFLIFISFVLINISGNKSNNLLTSFRYVLLIFFLYFLINVFISDSNILSPYTFKTSTYIWTISFLFLGANSKKITLSKNNLIFLEIICISVFFSNIFGYPDVLIEFFQTYSDKYELHKGSDLALFFIISTILISKNLNYSDLGFKFIIINSSLFLPLFLYKSRAAFIGVSLYIVYELITYFRKIKLFSFKNFLLLIFSMVLLTYSTIQSQTKVVPEEVSTDIIKNSYSTLGKYKFKHYQEEYPLLYFEDGRVFSGDGNLNWRLDMWQDEIEFVNNANKLFTGIGYKEKFTVFLVPTWNDGTNNRLGLDGLNEQIHNYFLTVFLRGGIIHLVLLFYIYYYFLRLAFIKKDFSFIIFTLSILFISSFDSSMENSHFPLIYYYFFGNHFFNNTTISKNKEK